MTTMQIVTALMLCATIAGIGEARSRTSRAETVIAASKRATGGAAWDRPQGCVERGTHADGAISYLTRFSLRGYGMRTDGDRGGTVRSMGFDGRTRWQSAGPDKVEAGSDAASMQEGIVTNYLSINGFFFPDRFPASFEYVRSATEGARQFDVLAITPRGGRPLEVWFDRRTHLIQRVVDTQGTPAVRVEAGDYRRGAGGLTVAYRLDVFGPDGSVMDRGRVASFRCGQVDPTVFSPPMAR